MEEAGLVIDHFDNLVDVFIDVGISSKLRYEDVYRIQFTILKWLRWIQKLTGSDALKDEIDELEMADPYDRKYLRIDE
jgi:hypothetical protein